MNSTVGYQRRRLADTAQALRLARTQTSREQGPRAQLAQHQQQRLDTVVRHAASHSPYYRRWFAQTGALGDGPVQLERLPVLDKALLMEHFDELVCDPRLRRDQLLDWVGQMAGDQLYLGRYRVMVTSGSSGRPGLFVYDPAGWRSTCAQILRSSSWAGLRPSLPRQRLALLGGAAPSHVSRQVAATMAVGLHRVLVLPVTLPCHNWSRRSTGSSPPSCMSTRRWPCGWLRSSRPAAYSCRPRCWSPSPSCAPRR